MGESKKKVTYFRGSEQLELNGKKLNFRIIQFWRMKLSSIQETMTRGSFAEFLVACALNEHGIPALEPDNKVGTDAWDIDGPEIEAAGKKRLSRIEVKSTANVHINTPDEKEPVSLLPSQLKFSIRKAIDWNHEKLGSRRHSDVYVFCCYKATRKEQNMLDLGLWEFFVLPTWRIDEDKFLQERNYVSVYRLQEMGVQPVGFEQLYDAITEALKTVK